MFAQLQYRIQEIKNAFPIEVQKFLTRALILFVVWKALYLFLWAEPRTLDYPLTRSVGKQTAWVLNIVNNTKGFTEREVYKRFVIEGEVILSPMSQVLRDGKRVIGIADSCNGLELFVLYIGFIIAMPATWKRKLVFGILGLLIVHVANILRCMGLGMLMLHFDEYFDFAHHYFFKIIIYGTIFLLWMRFSREIILTKPAHETV